MDEIIITSVISIFIAVLVTRYFTERMALKWAYSRRKVIDSIAGKYPSGIDVYLDGSKVDNLVEFKIGIWNSGNRPIRKGDFIDKNLIKINFFDISMMKAEISDASRDVVGGGIHLNPQEVKILDVNILDSNDYILLTCYGRLNDPEEVLSRKHRPKILVDIARIPQGAQYSQSSSIRSWQDKLFLSVSGIFYSFFGIGIVIGGLSSILDFPKLHEINRLIDGFDIPYIVAWLAVPGGALLALTGAIAFILITASLFGAPPKGLRDALSEESVIVRRFLRLGKIG